MHIDLSIILAALPLLVLGILTYVYLLRDDGRWILAAIMSNLTVFLQRSDTVNLPKIVFAFFFYPALFVWFAKQFFNKEKIIKSKDEFAFIIFLMMGFLSIFVATLQDSSSLFRGFREFSIFIPYLLYFPIRDYVTEFKKFQIIIWTLLVLCTIAGLYNIWVFKTATSAADYFIQVLWSRKNLNEPLFMTAIILLTAMISAKGFSNWIMIPLFVVNVISLGLTFTRGYWVATAFGLVILLFLLKEDPRRRFLLYSVGGAVVALAGLFLIFPRLFDLVLQVTVFRASGISLGSESLKDRLIESAAVLQGIKRSPIIGNGFGSLFSFYEILKGFTLETWYIHNGYLFLLFKLGVVGTALYLYFFLARLANAARVAGRTEDQLLNSILKAFVCVLSAMLLVNLTSPQFDDKVPVLIMSVLWGASTGLGARLSADKNVQGK